MTPQPRRPRALRISPVVLCLLLPAASALAAGGRDGTAGYRWVDSASGATPGPGFFDPSPPTEATPADDSAPLGPIDMGFAGGFPFYGATPANVWISDNGWVTFADPAGDAHPTPGGLPDPALPNMTVAPFWSDLLADNAATVQYVRYGRVNSQGAFRVQWSAIEEASGQRLLFDLYLYSDGRMKFHYTSNVAIGTASIGIENAAGDDGFAVTAGGVPASGVPSTLPVNYAIDIFPPPILVGLCSSIPEIPCGRLDDALPDALPGNVQNYGCGVATTGANEKVYSFVLSEPSAVDVTLTAGTAQNLRLYLLSACDETACLRGPGTTITGLLLGAGRYYLAVDAGAVTDEGTFTLDLQCTPLATAINCGDTVSGDNTGGVNRLATSACQPARNLSGAEDWFRLTLAAPSNLSATLTGLGADLDVVILSAPPGQEITANSCVAWGDNVAVAWDTQPGDYLVAVDGVSGAASAFSLETSCTVSMDCSTIAGTVDIGAGRVQTITGDTRTGANRTELYRCDLAASFDGPEIVYEIVMPTPGQIAVRQTSGATGLSFFVLDSCNEGSCRGSAAEGLGCGTALSAGTHYLVVDGAAGAAGTFEAQVIFEEQFNRWTSCENAGAGTSTDDTSSTEWSWDDGYYCIEDDRSINHPDGCIFAMYVTVWCGTEFHVPLYDVEGGHLRIFDVFAGQYVDLTAESTGGWSSSGDEIRWADNGCDGNDTEWNNQTTDIRFERQEGLCGIFRLEFINHSGFVWDLFANCTGTNDPQFLIHDSLCGAIADYRPLPNLSIVQADALYTCPDISVTYTVRNDGCAPSTDVAVELRDGATVVSTDTVPVLFPGEQVTQTFGGTFLSSDTSGVSLVIDPANLIQECIEVEGVACNVQDGFDVYVLPDCSTACRVNAVATITPRRACEAAPITVDATSTVSVNCPGGVLEYQLIGPGGPSPWQLSPIFSFPAPGGDAAYQLVARCADPSTAPCDSQVDLALTVDLRPILDPATVTAADPCTDGIELTWGAATWRGAAGAGYYNVYRSTISCADALSTPGNLLVQGLLTTTYMDSSTLGGTTYYYVVEAEDGTGNSSCAPAGPTVRGSTTDVNVPGGVCAGIRDGRGQDPATLPRIGGNLRLGGTDGAGTRLYGPDFVNLRWTTDVPIDPVLGHHFHALRSDVPDVNFAQFHPDVPALQAGDLTDSAAAQPGPGTLVFFYLVFTSDGCEVDNRNFDNFRTIP